MLRLYGKPAVWLRFLRKSVIKINQSTLSAIDEENTNNVSVNIPFTRAKLGPFLQVQPVFGNPYTEDTTLVAYLRRHLPEEVINK